MQVYINQYQVGLVIFRLPPIFNRYYSFEVNLLIWNSVYMNKLIHIFNSAWKFKLSTSSMKIIVVSSWELIADSRKEKH